MADRTYSWARHDPKGYEVSSKGDARFSAFNAMMPDGRSIEQWYQCDVKGYSIGGTDWRLGKGKPPKIGWTKEQLYEMYLSLWKLWGLHHISELQQLAEVASESMVLTDQFATSEINQARTLAQILNEWFR